MSYNNSDLANAFPTFLRDDALGVISVLPQPSWNTTWFDVCVSGEMVSIPYRVYHDPAHIDPASLTARQSELLDCLLTRHHDGFVRERHLARILHSNSEWIPPFVVQLLGEYVIEIIELVRTNLDDLDSRLYGSFLRANPRFVALTKQRVISYWACYYRHQRRENYAGFQAVEFLDQLVAANE